MTLSRRRFLSRSLSVSAGLSAGLSSGFLPEIISAEQTPALPSKRPKVAAVFTVFRFRSHAYNILENFFRPYYFRGKLVDPGCDVVSFYADQLPENDMAREVSRRFRIPLYKTIHEAVCLGGREFAVDAVLSIGEHGDYPYNKLGQHMYPRKRFFDAITRPMIAAGKSAPLFNDKHLSYRWDWAKEMYDTCRRHHIPFLAGSSVPLAQRIPALEIPTGAEFAEAVSIHGGGFESYDFHGLEVLQSFVESRKGGETGVAAVRFLHGEQLQKALRSGRISQKLVDAAMQAEKRAGKRRRRRPATGKTKRPQQKPAAIPNLVRIKGPHAIEVTYRDGFRGVTMTVPASSDRWNFACRLKGERQPRATMLFNGSWGNRCLFKALSHAIQHLFRTRKPPYPVERTLLVTGILEAAVRSYHTQGKSIETPHLNIAYQPIDFRAMREDGTSWRKITVHTKQPVRFSPGDANLVTEPSH